jgi:D-alanyl-lipoteichoic acid acyltransferase DltB (MBOAT superfamily)
MKDFIQSLAYNHYHPLLFNSVLFFLLFTIFYFVYTAAFHHVKARNTILLLFSLYFYYKVSGAALILLLIISTTDFFIGKGIFKAKKKSGKTWLLLISLFIDLGCLFYFKYANFFLQAWASINGINNALVLNIILPVGISFFVFKTLSYIFDLYRETIEAPERNFFNYVLYVSFFPSILAGPISKAADLLPQIKNKLIINREIIGKGFFLIMSGAFKKIVIADFLANNFVDRVFDAPSYFTGFESLMASYGYTIQLYFDFSGYTDIVIGIA